MGPLAAVGGLHIPSQSVKPIERGLDHLCSDNDFPTGEEFKWSPGKKLWMHKNLKFETRERFFLDALALAREHGATAVVAIADRKARPATDPKATPEEDVVTMFLERAHNHLRSIGTEAMVIADHPSGGRKVEAEFLASCLETIKQGTQYVLPEQITLVVVSDSTKIRLLQLADVIVSCTRAYVSGEDRFSPAVFHAIKPLLRSESHRIGGVGLKLHPDIKYCNLYHWLLGDKTLWKGSLGHPLPLVGHAYATGPNQP